MNIGYPLTQGKNEEWSTPPSIMEALIKEFGKMDLDPAAADWNHKAPNYFTKKEDGKIQDWYGQVFLNPPYGRKIEKWIQKAYLEWLNKANAEIKRTAVDRIIGLVPARTDNQWFHRYIYNQATIRFLPGRIYFIREDGSTGRSPWGSMIVIWE
jgi:site-specific DNA-methyltransferase (adenine-specific)